MGAAHIIGGVTAITVAVVGMTRWQGAESPSDWRARFTQAALQIPFEEYRLPERDSSLPRDAKIPQGFLRFRIASARTRDTSQAGGIAFRIRSDTAYPRLGIAPGVNYVWKDVASGKTRLLIIPADTAKPAYWLAVSSHSHPSTKVTSRFVLGMGGNAKGKQSPQALAYEGWTCVECNDGWCISRDTTYRSTALIKPPLTEITRYFARNHVGFLQR